MKGDVRTRVSVIGAPIDVLDWNEAVGRISSWAQARLSRYVCICNVHSVVLAAQDAEFRATLQSADMATPDGMPVAMSIRRSGFKSQQRINGPDLMWRHCAHASTTGESIFLYGAGQNTLDLLQARLRREFPKLKIAGAYSPPFRTLTPEEDEAVIKRINDSRAGVVWVSLGCPKQEIWMATHRGKINAVMVGVGAAFAYHAGTLRRAPLWMQQRGLEWLHRLLSEPRRLWKRYLVTNTLFLFFTWRRTSQIETQQFS